MNSPSNASRAAMGPVAHVATEAEPSGAMIAAVTEFLGETEGFGNAQRADLICREIMSHAGVDILLRALRMVEVNLPLLDGSDRGTDGLLRIVRTAISQVTESEVA